MLDYQNLCRQQYRMHRPGVPARFVDVLRIDAEFLGFKQVEQLSPVVKARLARQVALAREFQGSKHLAATDRGWQPHPS